MEHLCPECSSKPSKLYDGDSRAICESCGFDWATFRVCDHCGKSMSEGYCINSGEEYYCCEECLHTRYTPEEWEELYDEEGDSYWTMWGSGE